MDPKNQYPQTGNSNFPSAQDPRYKDLPADEFYRLEYIERLKTINDLDDWED